MATVAPPTRAELDRFLSGHTQAQAAAHYGVTDRTIRSWRKSLTAGQAEPPPAPATADQAGQQRLRRCTPVANLYHRPEPATPAMREYIPRPAHLIANGRNLWLNYRGELVKPPTGMTGARWNALQLAAIKAEETGLPAVPAEANEPEPEPETTPEAPEIANELTPAEPETAPPAPPPEAPPAIMVETIVVKRFVYVTTRPGLLVQLWGLLPPNIWAGLILVAIIILLCKGGL